MRPRRSRRAAGASERVEVRVDQLVADEERDHSAEREERAEWHGRLAPLRRALPGDDRRADGHTGDQRDEDRGRHGTAEVQAEDACELDVAHPHAARIQHRSDEEEAATGRKSVSSAATAISAAIAAGPVIRLGMMRWSKSMSVIGTSAVTSSRPRTIRTASSC